MGEVHRATDGNLRRSVSIEILPASLQAGSDGTSVRDSFPDGQSFLMVENGDDFPIVIVQNWTLELQRLVR